MPGTVPQEMLDELVQRIVSVANPDRIVMFGSAARGDMGPDSDVDLLVIKSDVTHRRQLAQKIYMNLFGLGLPVDVIVATPEDVRQYQHAVGAVIGPALLEGKEIYAATEA